TDASGQNTRGQIDLWSQVENDIWLIDYKSGFGTNTDAYESQLNFYEAALRKILNFQGKIHKVIIQIEQQKLKII
ncbi:MAG: PD-(D/E)XK nuclease family protein, partial [Pseudobdellovibrionaceae bacterium]